MMSNQPNYAEQQMLRRQAGDSQVPSGQSAEQPPLAQMGELDRFGLAGLLRMIHSESPDVASLAVGQDLMTLGLDLNQPEYVGLNAACINYANWVSQTAAHFLRFPICRLHVRRSHGAGLHAAILL